MKKFIDLHGNGKIPEMKKLFKIMRLTCFLLLVSVMSVLAGKTYSQTKLLNLNMDNATVKEVLMEIEKQSEFRFMYSGKFIDVSREVSVNVKNQKIESVLNLLFAKTDVGYKIKDRFIVLTTPESIDYGVEAVFQQLTVSGKVTDSDGQPLPGVTVAIKGTMQGTVTNADGNYSLTNVSSDATLRFSFVGMRTQEILVGNQTNINVTLEQETIGIEEVVAIGYGTQQKRDLTGSIGSVQLADDLESRSVGDFGQALYGKMAGVHVIQGSGRPGFSSTISVRGTSSISAGTEPLIVIDGVQMPSYDLNTIDPAIIESIEILKDASSSAIYGSRGANGVVLVTTKSGVAGKPKLQVNYIYSSQEAMRHVDVMNSFEYAEASIESAQNGWIDIGGDPNAPNTIEARGEYKYTWPEILEHPENLPNTDWQDLIFRKAPMHKINLNYSGGDENTQYLVSGGYVDQEGIVITSDYERIHANLKIDSKFNNWISIGGQLNLFYDFENEPVSRMTEWAIQYPAIYPEYGNDGYLGQPGNVEGISDNYYGILFRAPNGHPYDWINREIQTRRTKNTGSFYTKIQLYDGLSFRTSFNAFINRVDNSFYNPTDRGQAVLSPGSKQSRMHRTMNYTWENLLNYDKTIGNHSLNIIAGYEYNHREYYYLFGSRSDYDNDDYKYLAAGKTILNATDAASETNLISYLSRISYDYKGKYLISASFRRDGSSRFGPDKKFGNFPALGLGWRITEEPFLNQSKISNLKLRASLGYTGNDNFSDYRWISRMNQVKVAIGNDLVTSYYPSSVENPDLAWERTKQLNLGLDLGFFDQRINIEGDVYHSTSDNLLLDVPIPVASGFTSVFTNIGEVVNKGIEIAINSHNIDTKLSWKTNLNFAYNKSEVTKLGPDNAPMIYSMPAFSDMMKINKVGEPLFSYYGYEYDGVYMNQAEIDADPASYETATPGDGRYKDVNGDGVLNSDDRTIIGKFDPDFIYGVTNTFSYGNFDLSFLLQGIIGSDIYDDNAVRSLVNHEGRNYLKEVTNRWRSEEEPGDGYYPKLTIHIDGYEKTASSFWLQNGDYLRLKDVTIGYSIPKKMTENIGISTARVFFNGTNLITIADANVLDVEAFWNSQGQTFDTDNTNPVGQGIAGAGYPAARTYSVGINVEF
jgi:TonB-dependent starch-binding outer membrane protein SusC